MKKLNKKSITSTLDEAITKILADQNSQHTKEIAKSIKKYSRKIAKKFVKSVRKSKPNPEKEKKVDAKSSVNKVHPEIKSVKSKSVPVKKRK